MGFYSFGRIKILSRNGAKSAVATAAYHAAITLTNEYDGVTHDYSEKKNVEGTFIRMPESVPDNWRDENIPIEERLNNIWNNVETQHSASNARLARTNFIALQKNLTMEQNLECVDKFIKLNCTDLGMGAVYSVHNKPNNPHVDVMYLASEYDAKGKPKFRSKKEYFCRNKAGKESYFDSEAIKQPSAEGYEKVYKYQKDGVRKDMTPSEASELEGWERINKHPVCRTVKVSGWDHLNLGEQWRKSWEEILNEKFAELGMPDRVDCRSNEERGLPHLPTVHEGWGLKSAENAEYNKQVREYNREVDRLFDEGIQAIVRINEQIGDLERQVQTKESLDEHEEMLWENRAIIHTIVQAEILSESETDRLKKLMQSFGQKVEELIIQLRQQLIERTAAAREAVKESAQAARKATGSLADMIANANARVKESSKTGRKNTSWGDDFGNI